MNIADVFAFIANASYSEIGRLTTALARRRSTLEPPTYNAAELKKAFPTNATVELFFLANDSINGSRATVKEHQRSKLVVLLGTNLITIPASCAAVVDGEPDAAGTADATPILPGAYVEVGPEGKQYAGVRGVVLGSVGRGRRLAVALEDAGTINADPGLLQPVPSPEPNPNLVVRFKYEADDFGPVCLTDTSFAKETTMVPVGEKIPGTIDFGWQKRKHARIIARCFGARYEES